MASPIEGRAANRKDKSTLSNYGSIATKHMELKLDVNFEKKVLDGWVEHTMMALEDKVKVAIFDSSKIKANKVEVNGVPAKHRLLTKHPIFGTPMEVVLSQDGLAKGTQVMVRIYYTTSPSASACQWLPPQQTAGRKYPYLFTQSQAIHARSIFPCQDAPAVKSTYSAKIRAPNWATALMSALRKEDKEVMDDSGYKTFVWEQPVVMSSYLIALAVGELDSRDISPRCRIWAEPSVVEAARYEFDQTEEFLQHAEALTCPYVWERYDLLCLPPSFPYGGMENPCLTFVTPTLLAGDRSLADVVAHEISHSWSGNLVTNQTWEHFWLNEGWTMWLQRKIMTRIHKDPLFFDLDAEWLGWNRLEDDVEEFKDHPELTALCPEITDVDPDDAFSSVPYEKGFSLLVMVEQIVGTPEFEEFAKYYIQTFQQKTVTSEEFRQTLLKYFKNDQRLLDLNWEDLFYKPGLPPKPKFNTKLAAPSEALANDWYSGPSAKPNVLTTGETFAKWTTLQKQIFLECLNARAEKEGPVPVPVLETMDKHYKLSSTKNSEIRFRWNILCLRAGAKFILSNTIDFVSTQGRMKFTRPLYREMYKSQMAKELAIETFKKHAVFYHPICRKMVASDLGLKALAVFTSSSPTAATVEAYVNEVKEVLKKCPPMLLEGKKERRLLTGVLVGVIVVALGAFVVVRSSKTR